MEKTTHHPLRAQEDALKRALMLNGFALRDDGVARETEEVDWSFKLHRKPAEMDVEPILLEGGSCALRSELLAGQLASLRGQLPLRAFSTGRVYDERDPAHPGRTCIEGVWAEAGIGPRELNRLWTAAAEEAFGIGAKTMLAALDEDAYAVEAEADGASFRLACVGAASSLARALLGIEDATLPVWAFTIDVDSVAVAANGLSGRDELYDPTMTSLRRRADDAPSLGTFHRRRARNLLRALGFAEFFGLDAYEDGCYRKMNMIQESWDANNQGVRLAEPLGRFTGLPTVLTPALEEALAANFRAGEESCRLFEIRHIFLPATGGGLPVEKTALSFGGYGPDLDKKGWKALVDEFLGAFGIANRFYIPTDRAIAYDTGDCWLVMDQNMRYLESNFGSISPKALENHSIGVPAFMAQFELEALEAKADEEFAFTPPELG